MSTLWSRARDLAARTPETRNRYVDFLRAASITVVVFGHWLMAAVFVSNGRLQLADTLHLVPWTQWLTWAFQVMPLFFIVGGVVAPVAEEIVFRGIIFGYLRRWGLPAAVLVSTALFAALHLPAIPVTQVVGGMVFAIAYHLSGSLMTPILIHTLGNLAIFSLSLPWFY